jgi:aspartyl-tRNA(Asn)/glutamyl-tRNA(Gln) amidotransferase subunit C
MKFSPDDVAKVAVLARLRLDESRLSTFAGQFSDIVDHMDRLGQVDTEGVEPLYSPVEHLSRLREDAVRKDYERKDVLANAPETDGAFFIVPKIV